MRVFLFLVFLLGQCCLVAQDTLIVEKIEDVVISATRIEGKATYCPTSVSYINTDKLQSLQLTTTNELLRNIPGLYSTNQYNSAQDLRISIRGFGARSAFGIRGVRVMMDDIPLSTPDGQGQVDNIIVNGVKSVEVLQGASSALYGNASGGVVSFKTFSDRRENEHNLRVGYGSYENFSFSGVSHIYKNGLFLDNQISYNDFQGYREQSASRNFIYNGRVKRTFNNKHEVAFILNILNSPIGQDPGGVNLETALAEPSTARDRNVLFNTGEELNQLTAGGNIKCQLSSLSHLKLNTFYTRRDFRNRLPFENGGQVDLLRNYGGGELTYNSAWVSGDWDLKLVAGLSITGQNDERIRFRNLEGERGEETLNQNEVFNNQAVFATAQLRQKKSLLNVGLRYDRNHISVNDHFESDGIQEGSALLPSLSPSIAYSFQVIENTYLRAAFSYGFETPTLSELGNRPDGLGGFNNQLRPQQSYNYEIGIRHEMKQRLLTSLTLFAINTQNELLPFELEDFPGRTFYQNAGETTRRGIEIGSDISLPFGISISGAYTFSDFTLKSFGDFSGNSIPGIPKNNLSLQATYTIGGWQVALLTNYYSSLFANNANTEEVTAYTFTTASFSKEVRDFVVYGGINNLFNNNYYDNIRINAFGSRYYETAPPRNYYIGVKFEF